MSPTCKHLSAISSDVADYGDYGESAVWFGWKCMCCQELAYDGTHLELESFNNDGVLTDGDGKKWVCCDKCLKSIHLHCIHPNLTEQSYNKDLSQHNCK